MAQRRPTQPLKPGTDSTWLLLTEENTSLSISAHKSEAGALEAADEALVGRPDKPAASTAVVVELIHRLRAAKVIELKRAGERYKAPKKPFEREEKDEGPQPSPAAYDALCPFGYDIERELAAGRQPPAERVAVFVEKLEIPIVNIPRPQSAVQADPAMKGGNRTVVILLVVIILVSALGTLLIWRTMK